VSVSDTDAFEEEESWHQY